MEQYFQYFWLTLVTPIGLKYLLKYHGHYDQPLIGAPIEQILIALVENKNEIFQLPHFSCHPLDTITTVGLRDIFEKNKKSSHFMSLFQPDYSVYGNSAAIRVIYDLLKQKEANGINVITYGELREKLEQAGPEQLQRLDNSRHHAESMKNTDRILSDISALFQENHPLAAEPVSLRRP